MINKGNMPHQRELLYQLMTVEERYRNFMNATTDAIFVHNLEGLILDVNNVACKTLGYTRQELINSYAWEIEIAIKREKIKENIAKLSEGPVHVEGLHRRKDGTTFPVDVRLDTFNSMDQQFIVAIVRNISDQKQAEATIRKLTRALDQSPVIILITDKQGVIDYVNNKAIEKIGYQYSELVGQKFQMVQPEKNAKAVYQDILEYLKTDEEWHGKMLIRNKKGESLEYLAIFSALHDENNNEITHYMTILE